MNLEYNRCRFPVHFRKVLVGGEWYTSLKPLRLCRVYYEEDDDPIDLNAGLWIVLVTPTTPLWVSMREIQAFQ